MKKLLVAVVLVLLVACGPSVMSARIDDAYQRGQLSEAQYLQLKMQEKAMNDAEIDRIVDLGRPRRAGGTRY
jgi:hypothetical protein